MLIKIKAVLSNYFPIYDMGFICNWPVNPLTASTDRHIEIIIRFLEHKEDNGQ